MKQFRTSLIAAALTGVFAFGAAQAQGTAGSGSAGSTSPAVSPGTTPNPGGKPAAGAGKGDLASADKSFVMDAARSDAAELATSKAALQKASNPQVKQFAQMMIDDHTKTSQELMRIASSKGVTPPSEPDKTHQAMLAKMEKMSGAEFDRAYMKAQVADHEKAVNLFEKQAKSGKDPELKQFAAQALPNLREHLKMAQTLAKGGDQAQGSHGMGMSGGSATAGGMGTGSTSRSSSTPSAGATGGTMGGNTGGTPGMGMSGSSSTPSGAASSGSASGSRSGSAPSSNSSPGASGGGTSGTGGAGMGGSTGGGTSR